MKVYTLLSTVHTLLSTVQQDKTLAYHDHAHHETTAPQPLTALNSSASALLATGVQIAL